MRKPISPNLHGLLDYATMAAVFLAPKLLPMPRRARRTARRLAAGYTAMSALTEYPLSLKPTVPWRTHGQVDKLLGAMLPAVPFLLGFGRDRAARNLFLGLAAVTVAVTLLTDWEREPEIASGNGA
jgi:predicted membrane-bound mannosyltransferase